MQNTLKIGRILHGHKTWIGHSLDVQKMSRRSSERLYACSIYILCPGEHLVSILPHPALKDKLKIYFPLQQK